jgi:hypothetical protein
MHKSGCLTLIKTTLVAVPTHTAIPTLINIMRGFLWIGTESVQGGSVQSHGARSKAPSMSMA